MRRGPWHAIANWAFVITVICFITAGMQYTATSPSICHHVLLFQYRVLRIARDILVYSDKYHLPINDCLYMATWRMIRPPDHSSLLCSDHTK